MVWSGASDYYWVAGPITEANPLRHLIVIVKSIFLKGSSTWFVLDHVWPLLLIALITNLAANWMFRRKIA